MPLFERRKARKAKQKDLELTDPAHEYKVFKVNPRKTQRLRKRGWEYAGSTPGKPQKNVSPIIPKTQRKEHDDPRDVRGTPREWTMRRKLNKEGVLVPTQTKEPKVTTLNIKTRVPGGVNITFPSGKTVKGNPLYKIKNGK